MEITFYFLREFNFESNGIEMSSLIIYLTCSGKLKVDKLKIDKISYDDIDLTIRLLKK